MDAKTLEALQASIEKWERNAVAETPDEYRTGSDNCPLCNLFIEDRCAGCPVKARSGSGYCLRTPYMVAHDAKIFWHTGTGTARQARKAARAEVAFLKSLLPTDAALSRSQADEGR